MTPRLVFEHFPGAIQTLCPFPALRHHGRVPCLESHLVDLSLLLFIKSLENADLLREFIHPSLESIVELLGAKLREVLLEVIQEEVVVPESQNTVIVQLQLRVVRVFQIQQLTLQVVCRVPAEVTQVWVVTTLYCLPVHLLYTDLCFQLQVVDYVLLFLDLLVQQFLTQMELSLLTLQFGSQMLHSLLQ